MHRYFHKAVIQLFACVLMAAIVQKAHTQNYDSSLFKQYANVDMLPSTGSGTLYKDNYGLLWIGNAYGISIFNGREFSNLPVFSGDTKFYLGDSPHGFLQLDSNRLLITCTMGLFVFYYDSKKVEKLTTILKKDFFAGIEVLGFNKAHSRVILKTSGFVYFLDLFLRLAETVKCGQDYNQKINIRSECTGSFSFFYTNSGYLLALNTETTLTDTLLYLPNQKSIIVNGESNDYYVIATTQNIVIADRRSGKIARAMNYPIPGKLFFPRTVKRDAGGNYWIGGEDNLFIYYPADNTVKENKGQISNAAGRQINNYSISDIWIDDKSLFVSSLSGGLFEYKGIARRFRDFYFPSLTDNAIFSMLILDSSLYGAADLGGLYRFSLHKKKRENFYYPVTKDSAYIIQLEKLDDRFIWVLQYENFKLCVVDTKTFHPANISLSINEITKKHFTNSIRLQSKDYRPVIKKLYGNQYCISIGNSLYSISGSVDAGFSFEFIDSIAGKSSISCITLAASQVYLGTTRGELYALENGKLVKKTATLNNWGLPVKGIALDRRGNSYLMTINGLYIYDVNFRLTKHLVKPVFDLLDNKIFSGKLDKHDILWMGVSGGIISYNTLTGQIVNYPAQGLMRNTQFITKSVCPDDDGELIYFGGTEGVTAVNTGLLVQPIVAGSLYFEEVIDGKRMLHQRFIPGSVVNSDQFGYDQNSFTFSFRSISYAQDNEPHYKYMLEGYDTAWNFVGRDKKLNFLSLAPGSYNLRIKEFDAAGLPRDELHYSFAIQKPFWRTITFYALASLLVASLLTFTVIFIIRKKLAEHKARILLALALKNERERISQDLHDDLGSGLTSIRLLCEAIQAKQTDAKAAIMVKDVVKISAMLIDQMSEIIWVLNNGDDTVGGLLAHTRLYIVDYLARLQHPLKLTVSNTAGNYHISGIERRNLLLVIKEVFHNVIKHSSATQFSIIFSPAGKGIRIEIKDNGLGLPEVWPHTGNGLKNIQKRIHAIGGKVAMVTGDGLKTTIDLPEPGLPGADMHGHGTQK